MDKPIFYIARLIGDAWEEATDIEATFDGLHYVKCNGLDSYGKPKNIYTETFAETSELRVFMPEKIARENTDIEFEFVFDGDKRRDVYHEFVAWLSVDNLKKLKYWDTLRNRELEMILMESVEPDEDELYGSHPFIRVPFKFKNIKGETTKKV